MENRIAVVDFEVPARDVDGLNIFRALEQAIELSREHPGLTALSGFKVRRVQFAPTPAAAEREEIKREVAGNFVTLRLLSLVRAKGEIRDLLGPLAENAEISNVRIRGNTLHTNIQFSSCPAPILVVFELLPATTARILG